MFHKLTLCTYVYIYIYIYIYIYKERERERKKDSVLEFYNLTAKYNCLFEHINMFELK